MATPIDFESQLEKTALRIPGCYYVSLVGYDGITIAQYVAENRFDSNIFDAEIATLMNTTKTIVQDLNLKKQVELIWLTEDAYVIICPIRNDYFLYATLGPKNSNPGLARIELKKLACEVEKSFYD